MNSTETKNEKQEAHERLLSWIKPGDTVYTILRHVSSSGMTRHISVLIKKDDGILDVTWAVKRTMEYRTNRDNGGLVVSGCGMDMGFHVAYGLSRHLWPDGFTCAGQHCPANDHSNGDRNYEPHKHNNGGVRFAATVVISRNRSGAGPLDPGR